MINDKYYIYHSRIQHFFIDLLDIIYNKVTIILFINITHGIGGCVLNE